LSSIGMKI